MIAGSSRMINWNFCQNINKRWTHENKMKLDGYSNEDEETLEGFYNRDRS
jgi:hypothetical protein